MEAASTLGHQEAQALFAPMVDHELPPQQEAALKSHLATCEDCQQGFAKYSRAVALVRSVGREQAPADFTQQVLKRVRKRRRGLFGSQGERFFEQVSVPIEAAILVIIAAMIGLLVFLFAGQ